MDFRAIQFAITNFLHLTGCAPTVLEEATCRLPTLDEYNQLAPKGPDHKLSQDKVVMKAGENGALEAVGYKTTIISNNPDDLNECLIPQDAKDLTVNGTENSPSQILLEVERHLGNLFFKNNRHMVVRGMDENPILTSLKPFNAGDIGIEVVDSTNIIFEHFTLDEEGILGEEQIEEAGLDATQGVGVGALIRGGMEQFVDNFGIVKHPDTSFNVIFRNMFIHNQGTAGAIIGTSEGDNNGDGIDDGASRVLFKNVTFDDQAGRALELKQDTETFLGDCSIIDGNASGTVDYVVLADGAREVEWISGTFAGNKTSKRSAEEEGGFIRVVNTTEANFFALDIFGNEVEGPIFYGDAGWDGSGTNFLNQFRNNNIVNNLVEGAAISFRSFEKAKWSVYNNTVANNLGIGSVFGVDGIDYLDHGVATDTFSGNITISGNNIVNNPTRYAAIQGFENDRDPDVIAAHNNIRNSGEIPEDAEFTTQIDPDFVSSDNIGESSSKAYIFNPTFDPEFVADGYAYVPGLEIYLTGDFDGLLSDFSNPSQATIGAYGGALLPYRDATVAELDSDHPFVDIGGEVAFRIRGQAQTIDGTHATNQSWYDRRSQN